MNGLTFLYPDWFWGLGLLAPLLVLRLRSHLQTANRLPGLVSPRLSHRLIGGSGRGRRWTRFGLQSLALACTLAALARPQYGFVEEEAEIDARNLLIAIDTSRSMLSGDLPPSRLDRAKLAAKDIVLSLPEDRIGLIAFAGRPFLQAPLTVDHEAVLESIDQLDTEIIPRGGTNLSAATKLALDTFAEAELEQSALVIFSDGEALEGVEELEAIRDRAAESGMSILTVGVGTTEGSIIPEVDEDGNAVPGAFVKDENGQVVRTRLVPEALQALSSKGGAYLHLGGSASLTRVVEQIRAGIASSREERETRVRPIERFLWPLSAAILFLALSHLVPLFWPKRSVSREVDLVPMRQRAGSRAAMALILSLPTVPLAAQQVSSPASVGSGRPDGTGGAAIEEYERALSERLSPGERAYLNLRIGAEAYRAGNFERAAEAYGEALAQGSDKYRSQSHYNLGNTLFKRGEAALSPAPGKTDPDGLQSLSNDGPPLAEVIRQWEASLEHFETALVLSPDDGRAAHNREVVRKRLEELKQQQEQQQQQQEQKKDEEKKEDSEEEKKQDEKKDQSGEGQPEEESKKGEDGEKEGKSDPGQSPPGDPSDSSKNDEKPGEQPKDEDQAKEEPQDPGKESGEKGKDRPDRPPPQPGEAPPQEPEAPSDGRLEANPNQSESGNPREAGQPSPASLVPNPETGYAPTEARQLLDALADETEVRPLVQPSRGEKFKNW